MSEGPTTVGSINAKLTLDYSDFMSKIAEADAAARKLGSVDPNIKIGADTAAADSKIAATTAAAKKLGATSPNIRVSTDAGGVAAKLAAVEAATRKLALASEATRLSYLRLDQIQGKEGASALQVAAAHLAASRAEETEKTATDRLAAAKVALAAAEEAAAHAGDDAGKSATKEAESNRANAGSWQLITAAIIAATSLLAPLAGYAVGVAGALAGMGAAGGLAIYGIIKALGSGTVAGGQWQVSLNHLTDALNSLGQTAANAMLASFNNMVRLIHANLPELNSEIQVFGQILGVVGNTLLSGVINSLEILNPLFVQASKYVLDLASGFAAWTRSGDLQKFASYAMTQLPLVAEALGSLASAVLHIVEALAPLGTVVLQGLTLLGDAINAIPLPVILDIATAATAAFVAFKTWGAIQPILSGVAEAIGAVGIATQLAEGPIGWITAGISALAAVLAVSVTSSQQATAAAADYATALKQDNDAIGANVRATAAKQLQDSGALTAAQKLGLSTQQLTDAVLGNKVAQDQITEALSFHESALGAAESSSKGLTSAQNDQAAAILTVRDVMKDQSGQLQDQIGKSRELAAAIGSSNSDLATNADLMQALTDATGKAADETDVLSKALKGLGQVNLDASQANIQYNASVADAAAATKQYGKSLDVTTDAGRKNMSALDDIASSATALISAQAKAGASTDVLTANMGSARQAFISAAEAAGATADQANALADQYGLIPKNVTTAIAASGINDTRHQIAVLQGEIDALHGKTVQIVANVTQAGTAGHLQGFANGGTIGMLHAASGMTMPFGGSPRVDSIHTMLAPTEEVISNAYGQASNNRLLLKAINSGASRKQVAELASKQAGGASSGGGQVVNNVTHKWYVQAADPSQLTSSVAMRLNSLGAA